MQLLGKSLEDLINIKKRFSIKTCCLLAYQMVTILEYIHNRHIIHRDIKPDNFVMGLDEKNAVLYLLDFGLAKKYRSSKTLEQYKLVNKKKLTGTARYASINALEGLEQSRRDDLEAVGYVLMYFLRGSLPWQGLKVKSKEDRYKKILEKKRATTSEELCNNFPPEFKEYIDYTRGMEYTEEPKYEEWRNKFMNVVIERNHEKFDYIYDWTTKEDLMKRKKVKETLSVDGSSLMPNVETKSIASGTSPNHKRTRDDFSKSIGHNNTMTVYKTTNSELIKGNNNQVNDKVESKCCLM